MEGSADDVTQKIVGRGKLRRIVDKTPEEMQIEQSSSEVPIEKQAAYITNEQWQNVLNRLSKLETKK